MAYTTGLSRPQSGFNLSALRARFSEYLRQRRIYRTTLDELQALSDRELADLGLHRSMLRRIAMQASLEAK